MPSSAMSLRKRSATVQSATTRSFLESKGSWYRWYVLVTNQPMKPRSGRPKTSGDALVAAQRGHLAEHPVAVRLHVSRADSWRGGGPGAERAARSADRAGRACARSGRGAVAERPEAVAPLDSERGVDRDGSALVDLEAELAEDRVRPHARCPDERVRRRCAAPSESATVPGLDRRERRRRVDLHAAAGQLLRRVVAEPRRDLGKDLRRRVDEHPARALGRWNSG